MILWEVNKTSGDLVYTEEQESSRYCKWYSPARSEFLPLYLIQGKTGYSEELVFFCLFVCFFKLAETCNLKECK